MKAAIILKLAEGNPNAISVLHQLSQLKRAPEVFLWLDRNAIRGEKLVTWFFKEQQGSFIYASSFVMARLERETRTRPVFARDLV